MSRYRITLALLPLLLMGVSCRKAGTLSGVPAEIVNVRVGIPPGPLVGDDDLSRREAMFKAGHWTPVLVTIQGKGQLEGADLVAQTVDSDDVLNEFVVRLPSLEFSAEQPQYNVVTYVRPGKMDSPVNVSLRVKGQTSAYPEKSFYALDPGYYFYVTLGARLSGLRLPGMEEKEMRRSEVGAIDRAAELPARWFGYHTIDLAILSTTNDEFLNGLLNDPARRTALIEWVRRGGKLLISVASNQGLLTNREDLKEFLPVEFTGTATPESIRINWGFTSDNELRDAAKKTPVTIAKITPKPDRNVRTLVSANTNAESFPLVVQANYGLGRVTILTIDADQPPFTRWKQQGEFWTKLLREAGPIYAPAGVDPGAALADESRNDLSTAMRTSLESFDGVPVVSFGWVALFILVYIIVVGPLDYLFLKKVVKRLELTWVTFPIVVVAVSIAAYLTAYALKGDDQKINKIDLIDFDLNSKTATGQTWFSVFSPRVQNYTVGVAPAEGWGIGRDPISAPLVSWTGRADAKRQSLFRRSYDYDTDSGGLNRVPIQVWSTKGFHATWHHPLDASALPIVVDLQAVGDHLTGSIASNLPVPLEQAVVLYGDQVYELGTLEPGLNDRKQLNSAMRKSFTEWSRKNQAVAAPATVPRNTPFGPPPAPPTLAATDSVMRTMLFHEKFEVGTRTTRNAAFRELDQSRRIDKIERDERNKDAGISAIIYGTTKMEKGDAEATAKHPSSATSLWIGALPDGKNQRPPLTGTLRQETHVRFFVPIKKSN